MHLKQKKKKRSKVLIIIAIIGAAIVGFLVWLLVSATSTDDTLELNTKYQLPEFSSLDSLPRFDYGDMAIAIDGKLVADSSIGADAKTLRPTASTIKMVLALSVIQKKPFSPGEKGENITIDETMLGQYAYYSTHNGSNTKVTLGEEISEYDALSAVLLASSNNMADSLAVWAFGSIDNYREYASEMLKNWGINNTTIGIDACGFDESSTSTAEDLARIGEKLMSEPVLAEIVGTKNTVIPIAGEIKNTNKILGQERIAGIKTGYIGDVSGYCLISGYKEGEHNVTISLMGAPTREQSFSDSLAAVRSMQELVPEKEIIRAGDVIGYYDSWWTGPVKITANQDLKAMGWKEAETKTELIMEGKDGRFVIRIGGAEYSVEVAAEDYTEKPSFVEKIAHVFGWAKEAEADNEENQSTNSASVGDAQLEPELPEANVTTKATSNNCTIKLGGLMLINPNFMVEDSFIAERKGELVSISSLYGIREGVAGNGDNLLDADAATHINEMIKAYEAEYPGHTLETRSCFRSQGTKCGRLCAATGASDHHTGLTCDLIDPVYGTSLDTSTYPQHTDWQWLRANSYKYGFIDRFPETWAGGSMNEPLNVNGEGTTGLFETWHFRYVGVKAANEIASGKYNNGQYDSLEHYLKSRGLVSDLKTGKCE